MLRVLLVVVAVMVVLVIGGAIAWAQVGAPLRPSLEQPLEFPHNLHVRAVGIECTFCHRSTTQVSPATAGYPSAEQCMFCHKFVNPDRKDIEIIRTAYENNQPIDWVRVYLLPDHVHFVHEPHIRAGFRCDTCHTNAADQVQVKQDRVFRMGVCVDCHRVNNARTECTVCHY